MSAKIVNLQEKVKAKAEVMKVEAEEAMKLLLKVLHHRQSSCSASSFRCQG
jgi:hypothetical protein